MDLSQANAIVILFVMDGCPACAEFAPRFQKLAAPYQQAGLPVLVYNAANPDPGLQALADRFGVNATPTTIAARRGPGFIKLEGAVPDQYTAQLLGLAYREFKRGR